MRDRAALRNRVRSRKFALDETLTDQLVSTRESFARADHTPNFRLYTKPPCLKKASYIIDNLGVVKKTFKIAV